MRARVRVVVAALSWLAASAVFAPIQAGNGVWTTRGPWGGSSFQIDVHPSLANRVYAIGQGGMFRSLDGGVTWLRAENGLPAGIRWTGRFWVAPSNGEVLYLHLRRIEPTGLDLFFRSTDGAGRWQRINYTLPPGATLRALAIDALNADRVAIVSSVPGPAAVSLSFDGGRTFAALAPTSGYPVAPRTTGSFAWHGARMLAGINADAGSGQPAQVMISTNTGVSWANTTLPGGPYQAITSIRTAPSSAPTTIQVYAVAQLTTAATGLVSSDGGTTWVQRSGLVAAPWVSPTAIGTLLQIAPSFNGETFETQIQSSTNAAVGFTALSSPTQPQLSSASAPPNYNSTSTSVLYAASISSGLFRSGDNGATLTPSNVGFGSVSVHALASPRGSPAVIYAGQVDGVARSHALFRSTDGGASWTPLNLSAVRAAYIRDIAIDPTATQRIYAVGGSTINVTLTNSGIYRSIDNGTTWSILGSGLPVAGAGQAPIGAINQFVLDPRSCPTPPANGPCAGTGSFPLRTGYVVADGLNVGGGNAQIVWKSTNLDLTTPTFSAANVGLTQPPSGTNAFLRGRALVIDPNDTQVLYLGTELSFNGSNPPGNFLNGVFKSTDGGATWTHSSVGLPTWSGSTTTKLNVFALAIDPVTPSTLYAAVARNGSDRSSQAGVYKSTDGGATWTSMRNGLVGVSIRSLLVDPNNPQIVYAGGTGTLSHPGGVFRTINGGMTWNSRSVGLPADATFELMLDAGNTNPQRLFAGTNAGVWELTQIPDGDRDAVNTPIEDAAPNGGDGNGDGILDSTQNTVASTTGPILPLPDDGDGSATGGKALLGRSNYVSMGGGTLFAAKGATCEQINDAHVFDAEILPDDLAPDGRAYQYPFGIVSLSLPECSSATVRFIFHDANFNDADWSWRNFGPTQPGDDGTLEWYPFSTRATRIDAKTWQVQLDAQQLGNWRDDADSILFRGGPAYLSDRLFRDGFEP